LKFGEPFAVSLEPIDQMPGARPARLTASAGRRIRDIQVLRGIAVIGTVAAHSFMHIPSPFTNPGWLGVMLFFVISGFVVSMSLDKDEWRSGRFLARRAFRLVPVLALYILLATAAQLAFEGIHGWPFGRESSEFVLSNSVIGLLGLQSISLLFDSHVPIVYEHLWSLSVEDIFYASIALVIGIGIVGFGGDVKRRLGTLAAMLALLSFGMGVWWGVGVYFQLPGPLNFGLRYNGAVGINLARFIVLWHMEFLFAGVALFCLAGAPRMRPQWITWPLLIIPFVVEAFRPGVSGSVVTHCYMHVITLPTALICFTALLWLVGNGVKMPMPGLLRSALAWVGDRSYSLYLSHLLVICFVWLWAEQFDLNLVAQIQKFDLVIFVIALSVGLVISDLVYQWIEKPMIEIGRNVFSARPAAAQDRPFGPKWTIS
jgi:peptidoglycan/LPS O-acetylase OafA/YrhL